MLEPPELDLVYVVDEQKHEPIQNKNIVGGKEICGFLITCPLVCAVTTIGARIADATLLLGAAKLATTAGPLGT